MIKKIICVECPKGCNLTVETQGRKVISVKGHECPKGREYALSEIKNPLRMLTSTVVAQGLSLKMIPVRTDGPIPKKCVLEAAREIKRLKIRKPLHAGAVVVKNFLGLGVNLIATRNARNL